MKKVIILSIIALVALLAQCSTTSKFEIHAKISDFANANDVTYQEAEDYCREALEKGQECYYIK